MASKSFAIGIKIGGSVNPTVGQAFAQVNKSQSQLSANMRNTSGQLKAVQSFNKYKTTLDQLKVKQAGLVTSSPRLDRGIAQVERRFLSAQKNVQKYGLQIGKTTQLEKSLQTQLGRTQAALKAKNSMAANKAARQSMHGEIMGTAALAFAVAAPMRTAIGFEQSIAKLGAITQATDGDLGLLSKTAQELGAKTQFSASQSAEAMTFLGMSGFKTNEIIAATPGMLDLAAASGTDLAQTADIASNILSGFNLEASEMGRVGDILSKTFTTSNTDLNMLGETMKYVAPAASAVGASMEDVAAMAGMLGNVGIQGGQAGTVLRSAFLRLVKPPKAAADALDRLRVSTTAANGEMKSMPDLLEEIASATSNMGDADRMATITSIFGTEASSGMAELVKKAGSGAIQVYSEQIKQSHGLTKSMAEQMEKTTQGAINRMKSAFETLSISVFSTVLPAFSAIVDGVAWVAAGIAKVSAVVPWLTGGLIGLTVALVAGKIALLAYRYAATLVSDAVSTVRLIMPLLASATHFTTAKFNLATAATSRFGASLLLMGKAGKASILQQGFWRAAAGGVVTFSTTAVAAIRGVGLAMMANPIGLIVAGIIAGGLLIYKFWEPITVFLKGVWSGIVEGMQPVINSFQWFAEKFDPIFSPIGAMFSWIGEQIGGLLEPFRATSDELEGIATVGQAVGRAIAGAFKLLISPITTVYSLIKSVGSALGFGSTEIEVSTKQSKTVRAAAEEGKKVFYTANQPSLSIGAGMSAPANTAAAHDISVLSAPAALSQNSLQGRSQIINNTPQYNITQLPGEDGETLARRIALIQQENNMRFEYDGR